MGIEVPSFLAATGAFLGGGDWSGAHTSPPFLQGRWEGGGKYVCFRYGDVTTDETKVGCPPPHPATAGQVAAIRWDGMDGNGTRVPPTVEGSPPPQSVVGLG